MENSINIIGVDYGLLGSVCFIENIQDQTKTKISFIDMPTMKVAHQTKKTKELTVIDVARLRDLLYEKLEKQTYHNCYVEKVVSPNMATSKSSILIQGKNIGMSEALVLLACIDNEVPYDELSPQKWKNRTGLAGRNKKACIAFGQNHVPASEGSKFLGVQGGFKDGRGDAFCVGWAGYTLNKNIK